MWRTKEVKFSSKTQEKVYWPENLNHTKIFENFYMSKCRNFDSLFNLKCLLNVYEKRMFQALMINSLKIYSEIIVFPVNLIYSWRGWKKNQFVELNFFRILK